MRINFAVFLPLLLLATAARAQVAGEKCFQEPKDMETFLHQSIQANHASIRDAARAKAAADSVARKAAIAAIRQRESKTPYCAGPVSSMRIGELRAYTSDSLLKKQI